MNKFVSSFFIIVILIFFHFRGIIYHDEGYILNSALRVLHGQIPYRDFDMAYTPLSFLTTAAFLKIFGESVFSGRMAAMAVSLLSLFAMQNILKLITKNNFIIFTGLLFFIAWGPAHINFPWPVMFAICCLLYTILFFLKGTIDNNKMWLFFAGVATVLMFLAKQNFGVGVLMASVVSLIFGSMRSTPRALPTSWSRLRAAAALVGMTKQYFPGSNAFIYYLAGFATSILVLLLILLFFSDLSPFMLNLNVYTIQRILVEKTLDTPFLYEGSLITKLVKLAVYTSPLTISFIAFFITRKTNKNYQFILVFISIFYLHGIRPTTDYNHFVPLLAITCLPIALIIANIRYRKIKKLLIIAFIALTSLGFYQAYFSGYYKWDWALRYNIHFANNPRLHIFLTAQEAQDSEQLMRYIDSLTKQHEYIYVHNYWPLVYFLTNRSNATRYDLATYFDLPLSDQKDVLNLLKEKRISMVVVHERERNDTSPIFLSIKKNYVVKKNIGGFIIFMKKRL